jgi:hypothetical protein
MEEDGKNDEALEESGVELQASDTFNTDGGEGDRRLVFLGVILVLLPTPFEWCYGYPSISSVGF